MVQRLSVLVADDHPLYREAVVKTIRERPELELVGEAADGRAALDALRELTPDVAVLDVKMPGLDGLQVLNAVVRDGLATRVLLLSAFLDGTIAYDAVGQGAAGYLSKDAGRREIAEAVVRIEDRADQIHERGRKELFLAHRGGDAMAYMVANEVYEHLEKVMDRFEDVANEISAIVIEHV